MRAVTQNYKITKLQDLLLCIMQIATQKLQKLQVPSFVTMKQFANEILIYDGCAGIGGTHLTMLSAYCGTEKGLPKRRRSSIARAGQPSFQGASFLSLRG